MKKFCEIIIIIKNDNRTLKKIILDNELDSIEKSFSEIRIIEK